MPTSEPILQFILERRDEMLEHLRQFVELESPSSDKAAVERVAAFAAAEAERLGGRVVRHRSNDFGDHLQADFEFPDGGRPCGRLLVLGHLDTVWELGTLQRMPFTVKNGRAYGPGIFDMKSGVAAAFSAIRALRCLRVPVCKKVTMLLVTDEEVGSLSSRPITERLARECEAVLVVEPAGGSHGALKTSRKGVGEYRVLVHGKAAHAGLDFSSGVNANVELARQVARIARFTRLKRGITVNVGLIAGGTRNNVVPDRASANVDVRIVRQSDWKYVEKQFASLQPFDQNTRLEVTGELNRPPMERTSAVVSLFERAKQLARPLGIDLEETSAGGGSDGNFTAGLGIPTLDGLGAVGDGAHALHEHIVIDQLPRRSALMAHLLANL